MVDSSSEDLREASYTDAAPEESLETRPEQTPNGNMALKTVQDSLTDQSLRSVRNDDGKIPGGLTAMDTMQRLSPTKGKCSVEADDVNSTKETNSECALSPNSSPRRRQLRNMTDLEYCEDLVVATAVFDNMTVDSDQDGYMPTCIEYDPDSKPAEYRNAFYRRMLYAFCIVAMLMIGVIVFAVKWTNGNTNEMEWIRQEVETLLGSEMESLDVSYRKALDWMMYDDPLRFELSTTLTENSGLFLRFILTYFYFATSIHGEWSFCAPPNGMDETQCSYQYYINKIETSIPKHGNRWLSDSDACDWAGVTCNTNQEIEGLFVVSFKLSGTFPDGIQHLTTLKTIHLDDSYINGPLPPDIIHRLPQLTSLFLSMNQFTGSIPSQWFVPNNPTTPALMFLGLDKNMLTGTVPSVMSVFTKLELLNLSNNRLEGTLPSEVMGGIPSLTSLQLVMNALTGTIPSAIGQLTNLGKLALTGNKLHGTIPTEIGLLKESLGDIEIGSNNFTGDLPKEFYDLKYLENLNLSLNRFNGTLKQTIGGSFPFMTILKINQNEFTGSIPDQMESMMDLTSFIFADNDFTGTIPKALCQFVSERGCQVSCCTVDGDDCPLNNTKIADP